MTDYQHARDAWAMGASPWRVHTLTLAQGLTFRALHTPGPHTPILAHLEVLHSLSHSGDLAATDSQRPGHPRSLPQLSGLGGMEQVPQG